MNSCYPGAFIKCAWILLSNEERTSRHYEQFSKKYRDYLVKLIDHSQMSLGSLVISLYYLYKYNDNSVNRVDEQDYTTINYLILTSLVLGNKSFDDQSYTLKTWLNISNQQENKEVAVNLNSLNQLELHFLHVLDYRLSFINIDKDTSFWNSLYFKINNFNIPRMTINRFKMQVTNSSHSSTGLEMEQYSTPNSSLTNSPIIASSTSLSSSEYHPLTPITPYSTNIDFGSNKKRKIDNQVQQKVLMAPTVLSSFTFSNTSHEFPGYSRDLLLKSDTEIVHF